MKNVLYLFSICATLIIAALFVFMIFSPAHSAEGTGEVGATIVDPYTMPEEEAKVWCENNPESRKCAVLKEIWEEEDELDVQHER